MKKMLSLAAMFAVLSYASPASAELKIGGDASIRARGEFNNTEIGNVKTTNADNLIYQYKVRLKTSADLGDGYFFKALLQSEETAAGAPVAGGWSTVDKNNVGAYNIEVSNFYFGHAEENSHFSIGRLPLNSFNNPIFDLALYPIPASNGTSTVYAVDIPITTWNFDRVFGFNYGGKVGGGDLNGTLVILDNGSGNSGTNIGSPEGGFFNDGYALHVSYKNAIGDVTVEPQAIVALTGLNGLAYQRVAPNTFGLNATVPAGKSKIGASAFYTVCKDNNTAGVSGKNVDYSGYLLRLKGESGQAMAWVDYNRTIDKTYNGTATVFDTTYNNVFVWAQYNFKVHESASGNFNLTPTLRYRASGTEILGSTDRRNQLRTELYATVTF